MGDGDGVRGTPRGSVSTPGKGGRAGGEREGVHLVVINGSIPVLVHRSEQLEWEGGGGVGVVGVGWMMVMTCQVGKWVGGRAVGGLGGRILRLMGS